MNPVVSKFDSFKRTCLQYSQRVQEMEIWHTDRFIIEYFGPFCEHLSTISPILTLIHLLSML